MSAQEKFIKQLKSYKDYWLSVPDKSVEDVVDGVLFSLLTMIDGYSSVNNFHPITMIDSVTKEQIDCGHLHDLYFSNKTM